MHQAPRNLGEVYTINMSLLQPISSSLLSTFSVAGEKTHLFSDIWRFRPWSTDLHENISDENKISTRCSSSCSALLAKPISEFVHSPQFCQSPVWQMSRYATYLSELVAIKDYSIICQRVKEMKCKSQMRLHGDRGCNRWKWIKINEKRWKYRVSLNPFSNSYPRKYHSKGGSTSVP